jgi:hypothetical protein
LSLGEFFIALALYQSNVVGTLVVALSGPDVLLLLLLCYKRMNFVTQPKMEEIRHSHCLSETMTPHVIPCL